MRQLLILSKSAMYCLKTLHDAACNIFQNISNIQFHGLMQLVLTSINYIIENMYVQIINKNS